MKTNIMNALHNLAIMRGWYQQVTNGLPLNIYRTVFGTYCFECELKQEPIEKLFTSLFEWGEHNQREINADMNKPFYTEWKVSKKGRQYRKVKYPNALPMWRTETKPV